MALLRAPGLSGEMNLQRGQAELSSSALELLMRGRDQKAGQLLLVLAPTAEDSCVPATPAFSPFFLGLCSAVCFLFQVSV